MDGMGIFTGVGGFASRPFVDVASQMFANYVAPEILSTKYAANYDWKTALPAPGDMLEAWLGGKLTGQQLTVGMNLNNIPIFGQKDGHGFITGTTLWDAVLDNKIPKLSIDQLISAVYSGIVKKEDLPKLMARYSFDKDQWNTLLMLLEPRFEQQIIFGNYMRGYDNSAETTKKIRRFYGCTEIDANKIKQLTAFIPPVQDLVRFAIREVYNPEAVARLQLDSEYTDNKDYQEWASASGLGIATIIDDDGNKITRDIALDYWRGHWVLPAPTQLYQFEHRLRPERIASIQAQFPNVTAFKPEDMVYWLKVNDYTPAVREWLNATSYNIIGRIDLRRGYNIDSIESDEVLAQIKDQGYNDRDAKILKTIADKLKEKYKDAEKEKKLKKTFGKYVQNMLAAYREGSANAANTYQALKSIGMEDDDAQWQLNAIDVEVKRQIVKAFINQTKSEFYLGAYDGTRAYEIMVESGVSDIRSAEYVQLWQRNMTRKRKTFSTNQLLDMFSKAFISRENLHDRLIILGWTGSDVLLLLNEADEKLSERTAKIELNQARTEQQRINAVKRLEREMEARARAALARLMSIETPTRLTTWFNMGEITGREIETKLLSFGWPQDDVLRFLISIGADNGL